MRFSSFFYPKPWLVVLGLIFLAGCNNQAPVVVNPDPANLEALQIYVIDPVTGEAVLERSRTRELREEYAQATRNATLQTAANRRFYSRLNPDGTKTITTTTRREELVIVGVKRYSVQNQLEDFRYFALPVADFE